MPRRNWKLRVQDILDVVEGARNYVAGMSFEDFLRDSRTIDAVVRKLTIIGETAVHIPDSFCEESPDMGVNQPRCSNYAVMTSSYSIQWQNPE